MPQFVTNNSPWGRPGPGNTFTTAYRQVTTGNRLRHVPAGGIIDGTLSRDAQNTGNLTNLRAGLLMGKVTASGKWANSTFGLTGTALVSGSSTTLTVPSQIGDEIVRRIGASGTFKVTGPTTAGGTVNTQTITYSAVAAASGGNRVISITAPGTNQVETFRFNVASTGGNLALRIQKPDGTFATTTSAAWSATDATYISNLQTVLDTATGVANGIVASALTVAPTDTDNGFTLTYSGTGYAGQSWTPAVVTTLPTSSTIPVYNAITAAVNGSMIAGSLVTPTDGSELMKSFVTDGTGLMIDPDNVRDIEYPHIPEEADIDFTQLLYAPTDSSLITYVKNQLGTFGKFFFNV